MLNGLNRRIYGGRVNKPATDYLFSFTLWQSSSTEKLNASANAIASQAEWRMAATKTITKQKRLVITVSAFLSDKYFFIAEWFC